MGLTTFFLNYAWNSPFAHLVPPLGDLFRQPGAFFSAWMTVIRLHDADKTARIQELRLARTDDLAKRRYFMRMHGIEVKDPVSVVTAGS